MYYLHQNVGILFLTVCSRYYLYQNLSILTICSRYVWLGSDCLGPRGDDKSGCHDYWENYCVMVESESRVTSYRANRSSNLFQAAAVLHFHRADIKNFLEKYLAKQNRKIQRICTDNKCDQVDCHVTALDYYIGEVVDVLSSEGVVNFMEWCTIKSTAFAWPKMKRIPLPGDSLFWRKLAPRRSRQKKTERKRSWTSPPNWGSMLALVLHLLMWTDCWTATHQPMNVCLLSKQNFSSRSWCCWSPLHT